MYSQDPCWTPLFNPLFDCKENRRERRGRTENGGRERNFSCLVARLESIGVIYIYIFFSPNLEMVAIEAVVKTIKNSKYGILRLIFLF